jgi:hypothetical protein
MIDYSRYAASFGCFMRSWQVNNLSFMEPINRPDFNNLFDYSGIKFELAWEVSEKLKVSGDIKNKIVWRRK